MTAPYAAVLPALRVSLLVALSAWITVLSWRGLTTDFGEVAMPLLGIALLVALGSVVGRWLRVPVLVVLLLQLLAGGLLVMAQTTGSAAPTPANYDDFVTALSGALDSARSYAAPVPRGVPPVHALLLVGGLLVLVLADLLGSALRRVPLVGIVLLAAYSLPVAVTGESVSWWVFTAATAAFLVALHLQHGEFLGRWGRAPEEDGAGFGVRTGAVSTTAVALGATATGLALVLPVLVPTLDVTLLEGQGPGSREVRVEDPMVDLRRDLQRGSDVPLLWVTTTDRKPSYLRLSTLIRYADGRWSPGDREMPESQVAVGKLPGLDGVSLAVPREQFDYRVRVSPDFESRWLPTTDQVTSIRAGSEWRYDVSTRDVMAWDEGVSTAGMTYDFTGVRLDLDPDAMDETVSGASAVRPIFSEVPSTLNNEVRRLAASVTADAPTRFQKARALQRWFREDGGFTYDLDQVESVGDGGADLMAFLDEDGRRGYCEQFAASMAIMARTLGIPSRVAVGFLEPRAAGVGTWEFSAWDLHAWPELYFPGSGWVRFEPTPAARAAGVPGYTTAELAPEPSGAPSPSASRAPEELPDRGADPDAAGTADDQGAGFPWLGVLVGLAVLLVLALLLVGPRLVRSVRRERRLTGDVEDLWDELHATVLDLGHTWPDGRSPRRTGQWLGTLLSSPTSRSERPDRPRRGRDRAPEAAAALDRLVGALERQRYARSIDDEGPGLRADLDVVASALTSGVSARAERRAVWWPRSVLHPARRQAAEQVSVVGSQDPVLVEREG